MLNQRLRHEIQQRSHIEHDLREQKESFEDFMENGSIGMHWVGADGTILWANQSELDMLGYSAEEYVGRNIADFHADADVISDILARLTHDETLVSHSARLRHKDGSIRHVQINSNVRRRDGEFLHTRCFTHDITHEHLERETMRRDGAFFRSFADQLPAAFYATDESGVITYYNSRAAEVWGRSPVLGEELWCGSLKIYWPDGSDCGLDDCPMALALKSGQPVRDKEIIVERPDGSRIWVQPCPTPLFDSDGKLVGALNLLHDVSDRKATEDSLQSVLADESRLTEELKLQSQISSILAGSRDLKEVTPGILSTICEMTDGDTASLWIEDHGVLRCVGIHSCADGTDEFIDVSRNMVFKPGSGLPGRVLQSSAPAWIYDIATDTNFPRKPYAQRATLTSAFAFPLRSGDHTNGVIEIFYRSKREYDEERLNRVAEAGSRIGIFIDRQRAEEKLRDSESRFRALFEQAGIGVIQADVDGNIIAANEHFCDMMGFTADELNGQKLGGVTHPDDRGRYVYQLGLLLSGEIEKLNIEKRYVCKDGRAIWVNKTLTVVRDEFGAAKYLVGTVQDISPRIESEQVLRDQSDYLNKVIENSPVVLAAVDRSGAYRVFIGSALEPIGVNADARLGKTIYDVQDIEVIGWYERALAGETFRVHQRVDGHVYELSFSPHHGQNMEIIGAIALATDVTDRMQDEQALLRTELRLKTMLQNAPLILCEIATDGTIELVIGRGLADAGVEEGVNVGQSLYEVNKEHPQRIESFERALAGEEINYLLLDNGLAFNTFMAPRKTAQGDITGVVAVLTNITDQYQAQQKLNEREESGMPEPQQVATS